jgi:5-formyltetrahydrofolate cyclo-ligase
MLPRSHGFVPSSDEELLRRRVKAELRSRMRALRGALPAAACARKSSQIVERLETLDVIARARSVALFWPIEDRHEVDLRAFDLRLRSRSIRIAYPRLEEAGAMTFRFVGDVDALVPRELGLREPSSSERLALGGELDVIVVPALAVDPRGHRIGYGVGHYDRALPAIVPPGVIVVVAFDFQLVAETPETAGDVAGAWIVTDRRVLAATASELPGGQGG